MSRGVNRDDIDKYHEYGLHIPTRTIFMSSESHDMTDGESGVDGKMAERAIKNLHLLDTIADSPITVILNSPGGDTYHGMAVYDAIKLCRSHVTIKVYGMAMSMGSIILQAGDNRLLSPNAKVMIHYGTLGVDDHVKNVYRWAEDSKKFDVMAVNLFLEKIRAKNPKATAKEVQSMLDFDTILSAKETVTLGLADGIIGDTDDQR